MNNSQLICQKGEVKFGRFKTPYKVINIEDFIYKTPMGKKVSRLHQWLKPNKFQFISLISKDHIIGLSIVDLKYASYAFIYCYDATSDELTEFDAISPLGFATEFSNEPMTGSCHFKKGDARFEITPEREGKRVVVTIRNKLALNCLITPQSHSPLALCSPAGPTGWVYTYKQPCCHVEGTLKLHDKKELKLSSPRTFAIIDWSAGFMRRESNWHWATFSGVDNGQHFGLNAASGVNETGMNENACWINNEEHPLENLLFQTPSDLMAPWHIESQSKNIELTFTPIKKRFEKKNLLLVASLFTQCFGYYSGRMTLNNTTYTLKNIPGLIEQHYAKW